MTVHSESEPTCGLRSQILINSNMSGNSDTKAAFVGLRIYPNGHYRTNADFLKKGSSYYVVKCK